jgi:hypothetical protein
MSYKSFLANARTFVETTNNPDQLQIFTFSKVAFLYVFIQYVELRVMCRKIGFGVSGDMFQAIC